MANPIGAPSLEIRSVNWPTRIPATPCSSQAPGRSVRPVDGRRLARQGDQPGAVAGRLGRRGEGARQRRLLLLPLWRIRGTKARATGFFRVEKIEGKWWFVDPDGHLFLSLGADSIGTSVCDIHRRGASNCSPPCRRRDLRRPGEARRRVVLHLEHGAPLRRRLEREVGRSDRAPHVRLGLQYRGQLERSAPGQRAPRALCGDAARLGNRDRSHGRPRRLCARVCREHRPRGRSTVRVAQRRSLRAGIFPGQRAALAGTRRGGGGRDSRRPGERAQEGGARHSWRRAIRPSAAKRFSTRPIRGSSKPRPRPSASTIPIT